MLYYNMVGFRLGVRLSLTVDVGLMRMLYYNRVGFRLGVRLSLTVDFSLMRHVVL